MEVFLLLADDLDDAVGALVLKATSLQADPVRILAGVGGGLVALALALLGLSLQLAG
jgi:hypothetical protein